MDMEFWDRRYGGDGYVYGTEPNDYLRAQAFRLRPGMRALAVADGEGRNGVWLARQGLDVLSVDASATGLAKAARLAEAAGVDLATERADLGTWTWPFAAFDLVAAIYAAFPEPVRRPVHQAIARSLRPGGLLVLVAFALTPGATRAGSLYDPAMLEADFAGLDLIELTQGSVLLAEGTLHRGPAEVVRLVARAPGPA
jgi:SAM-dependent methyltransferase